MLQASSFRILNCYISENTLGFAEICKQAGYPTDLGGYYLRRLVKEGYIEKTGRGQYTISAGGKQQLSLRYGKAPFYMRPRMVILLIVNKGDKYIVLRRSNQPFIGTTEWPASDVKIGEPLNIASTRTLQERLGIIGEPKFHGFFRRIDTYKDMLFDDKVFAVHTHSLEENETIHERGSTGKNAFYTEKQLAKIKHPSKALLDLFSYVQQGDSHFEEHIYDLELKDLSLA